MDELLPPCKNRGSFLVHASLALLLFYFGLSAMGCSAQNEVTEPEEISDQALRGRTWRGWARIDTCYVYVMPASERMERQYLSCPAELVNAERSLLSLRDNSSTDYNTSLIIKADGSSILELLLAYPGTFPQSYRIDIPAYRRSDDRRVHKDRPIQLLSFDIPTTANSSQNGSREIIPGKLNLEQRVGYLEGGMDLELTDYGPRHFVYSVLLRRE